jgi:AraC family transcriptional regulator
MQRVVRYVEGMRIPTPITFGRPQYSARVGELTVTETRHGAGLRIATHEHDVANLYVTLSGRLRETVERVQLAGEPGTVLVKPSGARHSNEYGGEEVVGIVVEVPDAAQDRLALRAVFRDRRRLGDAECARVAAQLARELRWRGPGQPLVIDGLTHELLGLVGGHGRPDRRRPRWLAAVRELVAAEPERGASLERIAAVVGRHPSHVAREFRRHYGQAIGAFARRRRLEEAAAELRAPGRSLAEIAARAGFYDQAHFANLFRRVFGVTPSQYRRSARAIDVQDGGERPA